MAQLVGVINTADSPFCYMPPENWDAVRASRKPYRADVPVEDAETQRSKANRIQEGFAVLREKLADIRPDVLVVVGDDQEEMYDFNNFPALSVYVGDEFQGATSTPTSRALDTGGPKNYATVPGHPGLAVSILTGLLRQGYNPAFMMGQPEEGGKMCHAIMRPLESLTNYAIPTVPVLVNAYYAPQVPAQRCYEIGLTLRQLIEEYPENIRVAIIGSGGLWHTPGAEGSHLDEEFDRRGLEFLSHGDIKSWAADFDSYVPESDDTSQDISTRRAE